MSTALHIGLIINPLAGLGGSLAMKGSDGEQMRTTVANLTPQQRHRARERARRALAVIKPEVAGIRFTSWAGEMGGDLLQEMDFAVTVMGEEPDKLSTARDTRAAAVALLDQQVDIIVFVGGDGTARDIYDAVADKCPVLGVPAGVKMHSGVFAVSPEAAGELLHELARGGLVGLQAREVRDIDEQAFRNDVVRSQFYGEMLVPGEGRYLQHTKVGGRESAELVAVDIATWLVENMDPDTTYLIGPGSTTAAIMAELNLPNTLLGVDVVRAGAVLSSDADEAALLRCLSDMPARARIIVTVIGGQGSVFGRGNQQFSPAVIRQVGLDNIEIVAAKSKISELEGRPLLVDTNDLQLDKALCGYHPVITGYEDRVLYRLARLV